MIAEKSVCTTAFSYAGGQEIVDRHLPVWWAVSDAVIVVYPTDSPNTVAAPTVGYATGLSNKYGEECLKRQLAGMRFARESVEADLYVFVEYDAFLLRRPEARSGVQANVFDLPLSRHREDRDCRLAGAGKYGVYDNPDPAYQGNRFFHFPWIMDVATLERFLENADFDPFENGFVDRWLERQVSAIGLPVHDLSRAGEGYSRNTIAGAWAEMEVLIRVLLGTSAVHGVKRADLLERIRRVRSLHERFALSGRGGGRRRR